MMMAWHRSLIVALGATFFAGCGDWEIDSEALTSHGVQSVESPSCATCHGYPLKDTNHYYHLFKADASKYINGPITCMDCHSTSIAFRDTTFFDTLYVDTNGTWSTLDFPVTGDNATKGKYIRTQTLKEVDTLNQHIPIRMPVRPGPKLKFREYMTGLAHLNQNVDVVFDSHVSFPAKSRITKQAEFNPVLETCSAVACHGGEKAYRWAAKSKGLSELQGE